MAGETSEFDLRRRKEYMEFHSLTAKYRCAFRLTSNANINSQPHLSKQTQIQKAEGL
jgi:hypothetical protein